MSQEKNNIVEADFTPVEAPKAPVPRCQLLIGIDEGGSVSYKIIGSDQSLITVEGLLKYARIEMDRLWDRTMQRSE